MDNEIICTCMEVTRGQIVAAINEKGCKTLEDIQNETEACTVCMSCEDDIQDILDEELSK
ncbi:MAG: (2Fe-2S)-binding protein [Tenuifilaceae bacterium]|jgi:NAD(P)H-nitrite reductase large subunit|uniref:(2Fe-2S)-binding protein n=1 Tax=Perlabentimonas gracilis TaxID=2715279 RepID=UPI00140A2D4F|nr:(2Fe-2S)-binding protein [Perlabentimonas gracilis]MDX9770707.1 (2Fe-2S)-binding protein [Tenuifilaceae bacterium]NHB67140.1 (2Fe-2S)-binding protein [Perlabentimonas gracilis]